MGILYKLNKVQYHSAKFIKRMTDYTHVLFDQTHRYINFFGYPIDIVTNSTVKNPVKINKKFYNCVMFGNGKVEH